MVGKVANIWHRVSTVFLAASVALAVVFVSLPAKAANDFDVLSGSERYEAKALLHQLVNQARIDAGLIPNRYSLAADVFAQQWADEVVESRDFKASDLSDAESSLAVELSENIAFTSVGKTPLERVRRAFEMWMSSADHRSKILSETGEFGMFSAYGIAQDKSGRMYLSQLFGAPGSDLSDLPTDPPAPEQYPLRVGGKDRFETSVMISRASFPDPGVAAVYIANGLTMADALAAAPLAAKNNAPILLSTANYLSPQLAAELKRLDAEAVFLLGGSGAISENLERSIEAVTGLEATRIGGQDRFATSIEISQANFEPAQSNTVYLANGFTMADALAAAPIAASGGAPILLSTATTLSSELEQELQRLQAERIVLLGGTGAISSKLANSIEAASGVVPVRAGGQDRFETSIRISESNFVDGGAETAYIANGVTMADALAAAPLAAKNNAPILLSTANRLDAALAAELVRLGPKRVVMLGSEGAISIRVADSISLLNF